MLRACNLSIFKVLGIWLGSAWSYLPPPPIDQKLWPHPTFKLPNPVLDGVLFHPFHYNCFAGILWPFINPHHVKSSSSFMLLYSDQIFVLGCFLTTFCWCLMSSEEYRTNGGIRKVIYSNMGAHISTCIASSKLLTHRVLWLNSQRWLSRQWTECDKVPGGGRQEAEYKEVNKNRVSDRREKQHFV